MLFRKVRQRQFRALCSFYAHGKEEFSEKRGKKMTRQQLFQWMKRRYGVEPDYPWADENAVLRHRDNNKWFALVMEVKSWGWTGTARQKSST